MPKQTVRKRRRKGNTSRRRPRKLPETPFLSLAFESKETIPVELEDLLDIDFVTQLRDECEASGAPTFIFRDLLSWPDEHRFAALSLLASLGRNTKIRIHGTKGHFSNAFDAVLHAIEGDKDVNRFENSKRAAIEAAALVYPDRLDSACRQILRRFRELGVRGLQLADFQRLARNLVQDAGSTAFTDPKSAAEAFVEDLARRAQNSQRRPVLRYYSEDFYRWAGTHYEKLADKQVHALVMRFLQRHGQPEDATERFARDVVANLQGLSLLDVCNLPLPLWIKTEDPLDARPSPYLAFQNGRINVERVVQGRRTRLHQPTPANFSISVLSYDYDPRATCPFWELTLGEILPPIDAGDRRILILQEFMGWTLLTGNLVFQKFLVLLGKGANGKSTILTVWRELLGPSNVTSVPLERFGAEFRLAEMIGKSANIASEMNRVERIEEGLLKELTSGDAVQVNRKYKSPISVVPSAKLIFATNTLPPINDKSDGVWRRMIAMPFLQCFKDGAEDPDRGRRLCQELPGIFNWALDGARRLREQGGFSECSVCQQCADNHRYDSDPVMQFVDDECEFGEVNVPPHQLYAEYRRWCHRNGRKPVASSEFSRRIAELPGVTKSRPGGGNSRQRVWSGITLRPSLARSV